MKLSISSRCSSLQTWLAGGCAALLFLSATVSAAMLRSAEVTAVVNDVKIITPRGGERPAEVSDNVGGESGVKTGVKSRAELLFQDKTLTRLGASTIFTFLEGTRDLELERGTMLLQVPKGLGGAKVRTAAVTAAITGTTIMLEYSPAPWMTGASKLPPGVSAELATFSPEEATRELKKPRRAYSAADRAELTRRSKLSKKKRGFVKVMVLEGTLRLFLTNRVGESVLVKAGQMIILSPDAFSIPPAVDFDIARLAQTSLLVNNRYWTGTATDLNMVAVEREVATQAKLVQRGTLVETNLVIPGGGTNLVLAGLDQAIAANPVVLAFNNAAPPPPAGVESEPPFVPPATTPQTPREQAPPRPVSPVPELPGFEVQGSTGVVSGGVPAPASSAGLRGNFQTVKRLEGAIPVEPTEGNDFVLFSNGGQSDSTPPQNLTATRVTRSLKIPSSASGGRVGLNFDYRFFSDETNKGPLFPDQFNVVVANGNESIVLALDRNALSKDGSGVLTPVAQAGVAGYLGGTDWLKLALDLTPFAGKNVTVTFLIWDVGDSIVDSAFAVDDFKIGSYPATTSAAIPGKLTLNLNSVTLGSAAGEYLPPNLEGLPARNNAGPAADVGTFAVNTQGALTVNGPINASTGANGNGTSFGGRGGRVDLTSANGEITVNSRIKVSESSTVGGKASASGGNINLVSNKTSGVAISVNNTGELLALLNAAAPGPGGKIQLTSAGGEIRLNGAKLIADRGTIDVRNTGVNGLVQLSAAQLAADVIKVGALGTNGQLTINAGSQMSAASTLKLYGGNGEFGRVLFTGSGTVNISGNPIHIAANTVKIDGDTHVVNNGATNVHTNNPLFSVGSGGGKFANPVNTGPLSGAPNFD